MTDLISRNVNLLCTCLCKLGQKMTVLICFIFPVTCCLVTKFSLTLWDHTDCSTPGFLVHHQLLSIKLVMPSNHLILCCSLLLLSSIYPSIRVFSSESILCIRWPKYWSFNFGISPSNEYSRLISFRIDWLDFLQSRGLSRVFSNTTVQKHQFFGALLYLWSNFHIYMWLLEIP